MDDSITVPQHAVSPPAAHGTGKLPSPSEDVVLLFAPKEINMTKSDQQTNDISCRNTSWWQERSLIRAGGTGVRCWPQWWRALHPVGYGLDMTLCPDDPDHRNQPEKRSGSCSFIWLNRWSRAAVRSEKRRVESAEVKPPQQTRYGPDQGAPPSSSCTLSEPH